MRTDRLIQYRVSEDGYNRMTAIAKRLGFKSPYSLMQLAGECLIRYMDKATPMTSSLKELIRIFEDITGIHTDGMCMFRQVGAHLKVTSAIYIVKEEGKSGEGAVMVAPGEKSDYNTQTMFNRIVKVMFPSMAAHLDRLAVELGTTQYKDVIECLLCSNPDTEDIRQSIRMDFDALDHFDERGKDAHQDYDHKKSRTPKGYE